MVIKLETFLIEGASHREALQAAFDEAENYSSVEVDLGGISLRIDGTVYYPNNELKIFGRKSTIIAEGDFDILFPKKGKGMTIGKSKGSENDMLAHMGSLIIHDVTFVNGKTQVVMNGTLNSAIRDCHFSKGYRGIQVIFGLLTKIENCKFFWQSVESISVQYGQSDGGQIGDGDPSNVAWFTNASGSNSQSNLTIIEGCRFYCGDKQKFGVRFNASSNCRVRDCAFEGAVPEYDIYWDSRGSTTTVDFEVDNIHIEHGCKKAHIFVRGGRRVLIRGLYKQVNSQGVIVDAQSHGTVLIENLTNAAGSGPLWDSDLKTAWKFTECYMSYERAFGLDRWKTARPREITFHHEGISTGIGKGIRMLGYGEGSSSIHADGQDIRLNRRREVNLDVTSAPLGKGEDLTNYEIAATVTVWVRGANGKVEAIDLPYLRKK